MLSRSVRRSARAYRRHPMHSHLAFSPMLRQPLEMLVELPRLCEPISKRGSRSCGYSQQPKADSMAVPCKTSVARGEETVRLREQGRMETRDTQGVDMLNTCLTLLAARSRGERGPQFPPTCLPEVITLLTPAAAPSSPRPPSPQSITPGGRAGECEVEKEW